MSQQDILGLASEEARQYPTTFTSFHELYFLIPFRSRGPSLCLPVSLCVVRDRVCHPWRDFNRTFETR